MSIRFVTTDGIIFKAVKDDMLESISDKEARIFSEAITKRLEEEKTVVLEDIYLTD